MFSFMKQDPGFYRKAMILTLPIVLQNIITATLSMADIFMVGLLGETQMAALTLANIPVYVLQLFLFGLQSGASILISQYWGKQDFPSVQRVMGVSFWLCFLVTGAFALTLSSAPREFMSLFGNQEEVVELAANYGKYIGFAFFCNGFTLMYVGAYRSMGRPQLGMYLLGISMVLNLFFNWVFIFGNLGAPALGVEGAAIATLLARSFELCITLYHGFTSKKFRLQAEYLLFPGKAMVQRFWKYGSFVVLSETAWGLGTSIFPMIMGHMEGSTEILAALAVALNMERLVMVAGFGLASSSAILIGNAVGAGESHEKILSMGKCVSFSGFLVGTISGAVLLSATFLLLETLVAPTFQLSPQATQITRTMLCFLAMSMGARTFNTVAVVGVLRGGGDIKKSMVVDLSPLWVLAIPLGILSGSVLKLGIFWVVFAMKTEDIGKFFLGFHFIRKPTWIQDITQHTPKL